MLKWQFKKKDLLTIPIFLFALVLTAWAGYCQIQQSWICDLGLQFQLVYVVVLLVALIALVAFRAIGFSIISFLCLMLVSLPVLQLWLPPNHTHLSNGQTVSILNYNTEFQHNDNVASVEQYVKEHNPDIIVLTEVNQKWFNALRNIAKSYPHQEHVLKGAGLAIYSKCPIKKCDIRYFGKTHHPRIFATLKIGSQQLNLIVAHPTTPQGVSRWLERNEELSLIAEELKSLPTPKILVGDLNCGPWSPDFTNLLSSGVRDSEQGFGPQPSWPARPHRISQGLHVPLFVPIDHILISNGCSVLSRQAGPALGSDHLPVFAKLQLSKE